MRAKAIQSYAQGVGFSVSAFALCLGCQQPAPTAPEADGSEPERVPFEKELAAFLEAEHRPSQPKSLATLEEARAWEEGPLEEWRALLERDTRRLADLWAGGGGASRHIPIGKAPRLLRIYRVYVEAYLEAVDTFIPEPIRDSPDGIEARRRYLSAKVLPGARTALGLVQGCSQASDRSFTQADWSAVSACRTQGEEMAVIRELVEGSAWSIRLFDGVSTASVAFEFEARPVLSLGGCAWSGSMKDVNAAVVDSKGEAWGVLMAAHFEELRLPREAEKNATATLEWPVVAERVSLATETFLQVRKEVVLLPDHLWMSPGTFVSAVDSGEEQATLFVQGLEAVARESFKAQVSCDELAFGLPKEKPRVEPEAEVHLLNDSFFLKAKPDEGPLAKLPPANGRLVQVNEARGAWSKVRSTHSAHLHFEGWVMTSRLGMKIGSQGVGGGFSGKPPTHEVARQTPLLVLREDGSRLDAPVELPAGLGLRLLEKKGELRRVSLPSLGPAKGIGFWVAEAALREVEAQGEL